MNCILNIDSSRLLTLTQTKSEAPSVETGDVESKTLSAHTPVGTNETSMTSGEFFILIFVFLGVSRLLGLLKA